MYTKLKKKTTTELSGKKSCVPTEKKYWGGQY